jgi:hypothetical protein
MPDDRVFYLDLTRDALNDVGNVASQIDTIIQRGERQADTRAEAIKTILDMCEALQLACDTVAKEITTAIVEFNQIRNESPDALVGYFQRMATKFSEPNLRLLLHENKVCGELHILGDRFRQPFSGQTTGATSIWDNVRSFFTRSTVMSDAISGLYEGELSYLRSIGSFLDDVRDHAECATGVVEESLQKEGESLKEHMRFKRGILQQQAREMWDAANACTAKLH